MNYYQNNFYQNYSYGNMYQQPQINQTAATLQGKIVESADMVKVSEIPFGGFGIFPKGDLSEIYVKSWNNNGTTQINTYKPVPVENNSESEKEASKQDELLQKINELNIKLDNIIKAATPVQVEKPTPAKDVKVNAY